MQRMVRRKPGSLLPLEIDILTAAVTAQRQGEPRFHGFELAKTLADASGARSLTAHGTLYKALGRLEDRGLLASRWEDPDIAAEEGRPRRRLYEVTGAGERALAAWQVGQVAGAPTGRPGLAGT
jgi:PadR family transcriptional regulator PadR